MKRYICKAAVLAATVMISVMATACGGREASGDADAAHAPVDTNHAKALLGAEGKTVMPPREVMELIDAVTRNDARKFASVVSYPLVRPYPLRDVDDSVKMAIYYPVMVDDSLRNVLRHAKAEQWSQNGWKGWTLADGQYLWIDEKLYALNYVSVAERAMINTLANEEIGSLQPEMRKGWTPVFCLHGVDNGALYRVDSRSDADSDTLTPYRLAIYERGTNLHGRPTVSMLGLLDVEGTAGVRTYLFSGHDGSRAYYVYDRVSDEEPQQIVIVTAAGDSAAHRVERAYWRDYLTQRADSVKHIR